jgi:hypothetical protein
MSSDKHNQTLADWVALAISPALIMGLVDSLVFFLLNVLYAGEYVGRMRWILFFFVFGAVLIARMTMRDDTRSRAFLYGAPLSFLTWLGMQMFVEYPDEGGIRQLSFILNAGLIGLIWWCAHRLTWDCTNIDEETDINAEGLLQAAGLEEQAGSQPSAAEEKPSPSESWWQRWRRYREQRDKKRTLGVWVVYFSLAALPLFGLGQALLPAEDAERRSTSFWLTIVYVGCGLSLLLTTCFLGLRRYLRQRRLQMPKAMTGTWLTVGGSLIAALLLLGAVLPRPNAEVSLFSLTAAKSPKRSASKYAMKGGKRGEGEGRPGADDDPQGKKNDTDSGGDKGEEKGERGASTRQGQKGTDGQNDRSKQSAGQSGEKSGQGRSSGQQQKSQNGGQKQNKGDPDSGDGKQQQSQNDGQKQNKSDPGSGGDQQADKGKGKQGRDDNDNRGSSGQRKQQGEKESSERSGSRSSSQISPAALRNLVSRVAPVLKWIVFAVIALAVLFVLLRSGLQFLANFTDWARRLLDALRNFWANLFGSRRQTIEQPAQAEQQEQMLRERPFASFRNPFAGGRSKMTQPELIRYTFAAAQAWARERDLGRQAAETPLEFAGRVGGEVPALEKELHQLVVLYARAVYARGNLPSDSMEVLQQFWQRLEAVAEQPLSA